VKKMALPLFLSANVLALGLSNAALAQDEAEVIPEASHAESQADGQPEAQAENPGDAAAIREDGAAIEAAPVPEDRPYDSPLHDDPTADGEVGNTDVNAPLEGGPQVDESYNVIADSGYGLWKEFHIGPTVQLGIPHPITYGVEAMFAKVVSFGFSTGNYKVKQIENAKIDIKSWDVFARWHPMAGSFFLGAAYGNQEIDGLFEDDIDLTLNGFPRTVPVRVEAEIKSKYLSPRLGWFAVYDSGLTMGFEIGAQIPQNPETRVDAMVPGVSALEEAAVKSSDDYKDLKKQADDAVKILGKRTIPYMTMLKMGWLF
jgi:hypothetical protein